MKRSTFGGLAAVAAIATLGAAPAAGATVTFVKDTYTLSGANMSGFFGSVTASGSYGVTYQSNGKDYLFGNLTWIETFGGGSPVYTYNFSWSCLSITPHCGHPPVYSQVPGLESFTVSPNIDTSAFYYPSSMVPVSFEDVTYLYTGYGTLSETITRGSVTPEPTAWALMLLGIGGVGAGLRGRGRSRISAPSINA